MATPDSAAPRAKFVVPNPPGPRRGLFSWSAAGVLTVAAFLAVSRLPLLFAPAQTPAAGTPPPSWTLLVVGLAVTLLSAGVVYVAIGTNGSFPKLVVALVIAYNALIVLLKFVLGPPGVWRQTYIASLFRGDPQTPSILRNAANSSAGSSVIGEAIGLFLLYAVALTILFLSYRFRTKAILQRLGKGRPAGSSLSVPLAIAFISAGSLIFIGLFLVPVMSVSPYVSDLFSSGTGVLAAVIVAGAIAAAAAAFELTSRRAILIRNASLLTGLFWLGLSLLAVYHVLWVVYILTLLAMWPVKFTVITHGK